MRIATGGTGTAGATLVALRGRPRLARWQVTQDAGTCDVDRQVVR